MNQIAGVRRPYPAPGWMTVVLLLAAAYNIVWGASVVLFPNWLFDLTGMDRPAYPQIWQCVGMIVGVYGIGYAIAAFDPVRHWPIVLVGLLGKIFGPIGFIQSAIADSSTLGFGATIPTNDLIWWIPFVLILRHAYLTHAGAHAMSDTQTPTQVPDAQTAMQEAKAHHGRSLDELSRERAQLVVFLRHLGCTFCKEAMTDIASKREKLSKESVGIVLVHMATQEEAAAFASKYGLSDASLIADPEKKLYGAFGLKRGTLGQLFGPKVWLRGLAATLKGHMVGKLVGDGFQMPGVFLVQDGRIVKAFRHETAGDRPDYDALSTCPIPQG
ncbi:MAG: AhpC/TSA family protein [Phycisphaerales bacterium]|nr:MAG: AhpC/TSA family protein [Phycisphaerales bacterium]